MSTLWPLEFSSAPIFLSCFCTLGVNVFSHLLVFEKIPKKIFTVNKDRRTNIRHDLGDLDEGGCVIVMY